MNPVALVKMILLELCRILCRKAGASKSACRPSRVVQKIKQKNSWTQPHWREEKMTTPMVISDSGADSERDNIHPDPQDKNVLVAAKSRSGVSKRKSIETNTFAQAFCWNGKSKRTMRRVPSSMTIRIPRRKILDLAPRSTLKGTSMNVPTTMIGTWERTSKSTIRTVSSSMNLTCLLPKNAKWWIWLNLRAILEKKCTTKTPLLALHSWSIMHLDLVMQHKRRCKRHHQARPRLFSGKTRRRQVWLPTVTNMGKQDF
jgi:hypothetical protein